MLSGLGLILPALRDGMDSQISDVIKSRVRIFVERCRGWGSSNGFLDSPLARSVYYDGVSACYRRWPPRIDLTPIVCTACTNSLRSRCEWLGIGLVYNPNELTTRALFEPLRFFYRSGTAVSRSLFFPYFLIFVIRKSCGRTFSRPCTGARRCPVFDVIARPRPHGKTDQLTRRIAIPRADTRRPHIMYGVTL